VKLWVPVYEVKLLHNLDKGVLQSFFGGLKSAIYRRKVKFRPRGLISTTMTNFGRNVVAHLIEFSIQNKIFDSLQNAV
jgi:hypothetical protein